MEQEIMEAVYASDVVLLCGETGCGKTTQVRGWLWREVCRHRDDLLPVPFPANPS